MEIVQFETAKLATEKGFVFDYSSNDFFEYDKNGDACYNKDKPTYMGCSQSLLQKWLREEHNIDVFFCKIVTTGDKRYYFRITVKNSWVNTDNSNSTLYSTPEEALEEGLFEALKLI